MNALCSGVRSASASLLKEADHWLVCEQGLGETVPARHALTALRSGRECHPDGVKWLQEIARSGLRRSRWAGRILLELERNGQLESV